MLKSINFRMVSVALALCLSPIYGASNNFSFSALADRGLHKYDIKPLNKSFTLSDTMRLFRFVESTNNYMSNVNSKSLVKGAYMFKINTLKSLIARYPEYGINLSNWSKPRNQDTLFLLLIREDVVWFDKNNLTIDYVNLYLSHQLGRGNFINLLSDIKLKKEKSFKVNMSLLRNNTPCQISSMKNGSCHQKFTVANPTDYALAWNFKFEQIGFNTSICASYMLSAIDLRLQKRVVIAVNKAKTKVKTPVCYVSQDTSISKLRRDHGHLFDLPSSKPFKLLHPEVKRFYYAFKVHMLKNFGIDLMVPAGGAARTERKQLEVYAVGRSRKFRSKSNAKVTWTMNSPHRVASDGYSHAMDVVWKPFYSKTFKNIKLKKQVNKLIALEMRRYVKRHRIKATFLPMSKDPLHIQFHKKPNNRTTPTKQQLRDTKSWGWYK